MTSSWGLLRPSWSLLGRSWGSLGASWGALGGVLGALGVLLGRLGGDPKHHNDNIRKKVNFQTPKRRVDLQHGGHPRNFLEGLGSPKSTKIGPKTSQNLRRFSRAKKLLFKSLLEPSWADLEAFWRPSWGLKLRSGTSGRSIW